jgi:hypothetical protein
VPNAKTPVNNVKGSFNLIRHPPFSCASQITRQIGASHADNRKSQSRTENAPKVWLRRYIEIQLAQHGVERLKTIGAARRASLLRPDCRHVLGVRPCGNFPYVGARPPMKRARPQISSLSDLAARRRLHTTLMNCAAARPISVCAECCARRANHKCPPAPDGRRADRRRGRLAHNCISSDITATARRMRMRRARIAMRSRETTGSDARAVRQRRTRGDVAGVGSCCGVKDMDVAPLLGAMTEIDLDAVRLPTGGVFVHAIACARKGRACTE